MKTSQLCSVEIFKDIFDDVFKVSTVEKPIENALSRAIMVELAYRDIISLKNSLHNQTFSNQNIKTIYTGRDGGSSEYTNDVILSSPD